MSRQQRKSPIHIAMRRVLPTHRLASVVAALARFTSSKGIDNALLLANSGIYTSDLEDTDFLITPEQELIVTQNLVHLVPDPGLGLLLGRQYRAGVSGKLGVAAINCNTFGEALQLLFRYEDLLLRYLHYDVTVDEHLVSVRMDELADLKEARLFVSERELSSTQRLMCDLIGDHFSLRELHIAYAKPAHASLYQEVFKCLPVFNASKHLMIFERKYLDFPLPMANPLAKKMYEKECLRLCDRIKRQGTLTEKVKQEILFHTDGIPGFEQMARYMNISPSTLGRRLTAEGATYKAIVSDMREKKAIHLLQTTTLPIESIAAELGYSAMSNFYRAFKRWTGRSPNHYRTKKK